jgi:hypothetical protein
VRQAEAVKGVEVALCFRDRELIAPAHDLRGLLDGEGVACGEGEAFQFEAEGIAAVIAGLNLAIEHAVHVLRLARRFGGRLNFEQVDIIITTGSLRLELAPLSVHLASARWTCY